MENVGQLQRQYVDFVTSLNREFVQLQNLQDESNPVFVVEVVSLYFEDSEKHMNNLATAPQQRVVDFKQIDAHVHQSSCEQAGYIIDEVSYILRDVGKEKGIGFSMPVSLTCARQRPLLKVIGALYCHRSCITLQIGAQSHIFIDQQVTLVFVTPNVKPGADLMLCLIEAVHGEAIKYIDNTLTEDGSILKKGASVYNSELLLNGIVIQKLEYDIGINFAKNMWGIDYLCLLQKDSKCEDTAAD